MWAISLLTIMLLPLLSAAPLNVASDNDGMDSHDENVTRSGKFFGHNQFDVGNINISGSVAGDDVSIGHEVKIGHSHDHHHQEDDTVIECKEGLSVLFKSIDSNKNGLMDVNELLRVCHQNKIQIPESLAARISTIPDKTVGFNLTIFCELLKDCQSTNSADIISFLLQLFDKGFYGGGPTTTRVSPVLTTPSAVTCPYKDDLSSVLLVNNWRTQNQINEMSEEDKRNAVIAEVEQMTGHTNADLQRRGNTGDLGSLTSIANMAAFLIKSFIKSSSDVKAMKYKPDLRNTLIIEISQRCSIEVNTLQSKTDHQLLKTFFEEGGRCGQCSCGRTDAAPHVRGSRVEHLEDRLQKGQKLLGDQNESLRSLNGEYNLVMQSDGNLVIYRKQNNGRTATYATGTSGGAGSYLEFQEDGNLVIYEKFQLALPWQKKHEIITKSWSTKILSQSADSVRMENDGNLVVYAANNKIWASDTGDLISVIVKNFKKVGSYSYDLPETGIDIKLVEAKMYDGRLTGLRNIHRTGTSCFKIMDDNTAKVTGQLKLDNLQFHYSARAGILCDVFKWCPEVSIDGKIKSVTAYLVVEFGLTPGNEKPTIKNLWVDDISDISVDGNVTSKILDNIIKLLTGFLIEFIKGPLKIIIGNALDLFSILEESHLSHMLH